MSAPTKAAATPAPILLIEDEPAVTAFLRAALERKGYAVVPAASGAEGLQLLASGHFLGVLSDVRTPGGVSGTDVRAWIRAHRPELCGRIIFITGDTANSETLALLKQSGTPCVEKPFRLHEILSIVEETFGKPQRRP